MPGPRPRAPTGEPSGSSGPLTFAGIYGDHAPTVARWAARLGGPAADVEDIIQEVFLVASRRLGEFREGARVSTWLFGITAKVAANERRRRRLRHWWFRLAPGAGDEFDQIVFAHWMPPSTITFVAPVERTASTSACIPTTWLPLMELDVPDD